MIDFDEEVMKFQPCLDVNQTEESIHKSDMTDFADIIETVIKNSQMVVQEVPDFIDPYQ